MLSNLKSTPISSYDVDPSYGVNSCLGNFQMFQKILKVLKKTISSDFFSRFRFPPNQNQKKSISILRRMQKEKWEIEIYFQPLLVLICGEFETLTNEVQVLLSKTNKSVKLKYLKVTLLLFALTLITMVMMMPMMMRMIFWEQFLSPPSPLSPHPPPQRIAK